MFDIDTCTSTPSPSPSHLALKMNKTEGFSRGIDHYRKYHNIPLIMPFVCHPKILHTSIVYGLRETENNAYAKFWGDEQRALCYGIFCSGQLY